MAEPLLIAKNGGENYLFPRMANRHGLVAGATGTGKTITLQVLAESFSRIGVPVFLADVKGDVSGISQPGKENPKVSERVQKMGLSDFRFEGCPTVFWDIDGKKGHPVRTTISEMGPVLLSRLLDLNDTQSGTLTLIFRIADDQGLLLLDMKDLRSMVQFVGENAAEFNTQYGLVSSASIGAIQRALLTLEEAGGDKLFGEPALNIDDLIQTGAGGKGVINILAAENVIHSPKIYSTFLLWLMSELFERMPEVGDLEKPKMVFFFDEAHLLFNEAPKALLEKIEQVVRLIRSKGVGIYFVTQNPLDIPETVLGQLGNRVQHALRAFTPRDQKAVKSAAETFRANPKINVEQAITEMGVGEALVSFLDEEGIPGMVQRSLICPPRSQIGPISDQDRTQFIQSSDIYGAYEKVVDRESAYEILSQRAETLVAEAGAQSTVNQPEKTTRNSGGKTSNRQSVMETFLKSTARSIGTQVGHTIRGGAAGSGGSLVRGILGSLFRR